jgi:hypothetical protein
MHLAGTGHAGEGRLWSPNRSREVKQAAGAAKPVCQFVALMNPTHSPTPLPTACEYPRIPMSESR